MDDLGPLVKEKGKILPPTRYDDVSVTLYPDRVQKIDMIDDATGEVTSVIVYNPDKAVRSIPKRIPRAKFRLLKRGLFYLSAVADGVALGLWLSEESGVYPNTAELTSIGLLVPEGKTHWQAYKEWVYWKMFIGRNLRERAINRERFWSYNDLADFYSSDIDAVPDVESQLELNMWCRDVRRFVNAPALGADHMQLVLKVNGVKSLLMGTIRQPIEANGLGTYDIAQLELIHLTGNSLAVLPETDPVVDMRDLVCHQPGEVDGKLNNRNNLPDLLNEIQEMKDSNGLIITARKSNEGSEGIENRFYVMFMFLEKQEDGRVILKARQLTVWQEGTPYPVWFEVDESGNVINAGID